MTALSAEVIQFVKMVSLVAGSKNTIVKPAIRMAVLIPKGGIAKSNANWC